MLRLAHGDIPHRLAVLPFQEGTGDRSGSAAFVDGVQTGHRESECAGCGLHRGLWPPKALIGAFAFKDGSEGFEDDSDVQ